MINQNSSFYFLENNKLFCLIRGKLTLFILKYSKVNTIITKNKVERLTDGKIMTIIIPDKKLGYYNSVLQLNQKGYGDFKDFIEQEMVRNNPQMFKHINTVTGF